MKDILVENGSFEALIQGNYLYVDKTKFLYEIVKKPSRYYFLSRPRRFGKTLTLSTLEAIFKGKRELFKGLYIDSTDYDWKEYPVIHIDFSDIQFDDINDLKNQIKNLLIEIAEQYGIMIPSGYKYNEVLRTLITEVAKKEKVVVLIDEYDSILTGSINNEDLEKVREAVRGFYSGLKKQSSKIRTCFITGVTKLSKVSIFSAMNNFTDISLETEYATMLGYTQKELEDNFAEYIDEGFKKNNTTKEEYLSALKRWYNGYRFTVDEETVYNPVSIGSFFNQGGSIFRNYWINTGGMTSLLTEVAKRVKFDISLAEEITISEEKLHSPDLVQMIQTDVTKDNFIALLYQSGYLTIKTALSVREGYLLTLGYPNKEVEKGLNEILLPAYLGSAANNFDKLVIANYFDTGNTRKAMESLSAIFASIPYYELVFDSESAWHAGFVCIMNMLEADIIPEQTTNKGRIDCVLRCPNDVYVIEFKFNQSANIAITQIRENKYYEPYLTCGKTVHLLGINFSTKEKNIIEWHEEILSPSNAGY